MDKHNMPRENEPETRGLERPLSRGKEMVVEDRGHFAPPAWYWGDPYSMMGRFAQQMERLFDDFGFNRVGSPANGMWIPHIDVFEREGLFCVRADLPGMKKEDVKIEVIDDALVIQGERHHERERTDRGYYRSERGYGHFHRAIPLPEGANSDDVRATFRDGVLEVTMPAPRSTSDSRRRAITIH
jgi:HSP20 family protein